MLLMNYGKSSTRENRAGKAREHYEVIDGGATDLDDHRSHDGMGCLWVERGLCGLGCFSRGGRDSLGCVSHGSRGHCGAVGAGGSLGLVSFESLEEQRQIAPEVGWHRLVGCQAGCHHKLVHKRVAVLRSRGVGLL
jgi:hypothetical protein